METTRLESTLRCQSCGTITTHLQAVKHSVRSLSLGREVHTGDLVCKRCGLELEEEFSQEESLRGPA